MPGWTQPVDLHLHCCLPEGHAELDETDEKFSCSHLAALREDWPLGNNIYGAGPHHGGDRRWFIFEDEEAEICAR
jgi:hypothetical protein